MYFDRDSRETVSSCLRPSKRQQAGMRSNTHLFISHSSQNNSSAPDKTRGKPSTMQQQFSSHQHALLAAVVQRYASSGSPDWRDFSPNEINEWLVALQHTHDVIMGSAATGEFANNVSRPRRPVVSRTKGERCRRERKQKRATQVQVAYEMFLFRQLGNE
jgi:hypothetical protein